MFDFAICEIGGKQIKVLPNIPFEVILQEGENPLSKTLLMVEDGKVSLGKPYLKEDIKFKVVEQRKGKKIRVFKYHAKANFRRLKGYRSQLTKIVSGSVKNS